MCHHPSIPPSPAPPRGEAPDAIRQHQSLTTSPAATEDSRGPRRGDSGCFWGHPRVPIGRWRPWWVPCPQEDATACFWCALASASINALMHCQHGAAARLDAYACWGGTTLGTATRPPGGGGAVCAPHPRMGAFAGLMSHSRVVVVGGDVPCLGGGGKSHTTAPRRGRCFGKVGPARQEGERGSPGLSGDSTRAGR